MIEPEALRWYLSGGRGNMNAAVSLGGGRSHRQIGEGVGNLFGDVSGDQAADGATVYRCLFFRVEADDAAGLIEPRCWVEHQPGSFERLELGLDPGGKNADAVSLEDEFTAPRGVRFSIPSSKREGMRLPGSPYRKGDCVAIWLRRTTEPGATPTPLASAGIRVEGDTY